jgi:hypothetical protein
MIGYFLKLGDEAVSEMFTPYIWEEHGFDSVLKNKFLKANYGPDLNLLLIMYYVEGKFDINGPEFLKVSNYSHKNKNISVAIMVRSEQFHNRNEFERREFIIDSTIKAIDQVRAKLEKKKLNIRFDELMSDIIAAGNVYLKYEKPIGDNTL